MADTGVTHDDWMEKLLECPICLNVPKDLPIPACPVGHIICKNCRDSVTSCPTCRRELSQDGANSLAASMIEKLPHKCKFAEFGCEVKVLLSQLKNHEEKCKERTIRCPYKSCGTVVQLKKFREHALEKKCCIEILGTKIYLTLSTGFMQWDGLSKNRGNEFNLDKEMNPELVYYGNDVFRFTKYVPHLRSLVFAVIMAKDPAEVDNYSAEITIYKEDAKDYKVTFNCPLIPLEQFPSEESLQDDDRCWNVHYSFFKKFLHFEDKGSNNNHNWTVILKWEVEITNNNKRRKI